jgi:hypothetical protein
MRKIAGGGRPEKPRRVVAVEPPPDWSRPGWLVPPSGMPSPVPVVPQVLWGEARARQVEAECDGVVVTVARKLLRVKKWRKYREVVEGTPVPGSAGASTYFAAVVREWTPPVPWPPWRGPWRPAVFVALVGLVEAFRGEAWTIDVLRQFCRRVVLDATPSRRRRGRPALDTFNRTDDVVAAYVRTQRGRPDGSLSNSEVAALHRQLGYAFSHLGPNTDPARQLKWNRTRRQRRAQAADTVPARRPHRPAR